MVIKLKISVAAPSGFATLIFLSELALVKIHKVLFTNAVKTFGKKLKLFKNG